LCKQITEDSVRHGMQLRPSHSTSGTCGLEAGSVALPGHPESKTSAAEISEELFLAIQKSSERVQRAPKRSIRLHAVMR